MLYLLQEDAYYSYHFIVSIVYETNVVIVVGCCSRGASVFWVENEREQLFIEMLLNIIFIINE